VLKEEGGGVEYSLGAATSATLTPSFVRPRTRKIAILGFAETVRDCPWRDPSWELWGMNGFWRAAEKDFGVSAPEERYSLWFDMHSLEYTKKYGQVAGFGDAQEKWLKSPHPFPILMLEENHELPAVVRYPIERVVERVGRDYFTSTIAYALGYALTLDDVAEVGLWGIDLVHDTEYSDQRPCAEYLIGRAESAGVKVTIHERSALLKQRHRYGYESANPLMEELRHALRIRVDSLQKQHAEATEANAKAIATTQTVDGALQLIKDLWARLDAWERGGRM
jgi:hypothetical protein